MEKVQKEEEDELYLQIQDERRKKVKSATRFWGNEKLQFNLESLLLRFYSFFFIVLLCVVVGILEAQIVKNLNNF